jgi:hypothetical protein
LNHSVLLSESHETREREREREREERTKRKSTFIAEEPHSYHILFPLDFKTQPSPISFPGRIHFTSPAQKGLQRSPPSSGMPGPGFVVE